jgi:NNP family nitrate/nitrite transporter-like MFS transporter
MAEINKLRFRWVVLGLAWLSWLLIGTAVLSIGAMLTILIPQFGLTGVQAGTLMAVSWIPGIFFAVPAGILIARYGGRKLGTLGLLSLATGLILIAFSSTFELLALARFILGIGVTFIGAPPIAWAIKWFPPEDRGLVSGILASGFGTGGVIGVFAMGYILSIFGIFLTAVSFGFLSLVCMLLFLIARQKLPEIGLSEGMSASSTSFFEPVSQAFRNFELWKIGAAWFVIVGITTAYATFAPTTFVSLLKMDIASAAATAGIASILAVPSLLGGGWISDKLKPKFGRKVIIWIPTLICAPAFYLIGVSSVFFFFAVIGTVFIGIFNWISNASVFSAASESVDPTLEGFALGFISFMASFGSFILPLIMGFVFDATGSWALTWLVPSLTALIGSIIAFFSKK